MSTREREESVNKWVAALKESGLDGLSHEDGWTIMLTSTADAMRDELQRQQRVVEELREENAKLSKMVPTLLPPRKPHIAPWDDDAALAPKETP